LSEGVTGSVSFRSSLKRVAQKLVGRSDVRSFWRTRQLALRKKIYRTPVSVQTLRDRFAQFGMAAGRTVWVQSSWNEFFNVPMRPAEVIDLMRDVIGPTGTLVMPAFPIDQDPDKVFLADRAPVYTGLLCEMFRRLPGVQRSIHLSSSVCAIGPNAEFLLKDHHRTLVPWGQDSPFGRLMEVDALIVGLGLGPGSMTPLHVVECVLYDEVPYFRLVFKGVTRYRWRLSTGETGEHEFLNRIGRIRPQALVRHFGADVCMRSRDSNLQMCAAGARAFINHAIALARTGITWCIDPAPSPALFVTNSAYSLEKPS
jgi:aminoglycoside 3-N-acetyltransferase